MRKIGLEKGLNYSSIPYEQDGWVDAKKFMPADFDLCFLKIKNKKSRFGWATGFKWDGLNIDEDDEVLYWKIKKEKSEGKDAIG